jgi:hypothetical protein
MQVDLFELAVVEKAAESNQVETQGLVTMPALHPQIKVPFASAANMILEPSCAASAPRYI